MAAAAAAAAAACTAAAAAATAAAATAAAATADAAEMVRLLGRRAKGALEIVQSDDHGFTDPLSGVCMCSVRCDCCNGDNFGGGVETNKGGGGVETNQKRNGYMSKGRKQRLIEMSTCRNNMETNQG